MDESLWGLMNIIAPAVLVVVLIWLVIKVRRKPGTRDDARTEAGTREVYREEEQRRREGTDDL